MMHSASTALSAFWLCYLFYWTTTAAVGVSTTARPETTVPGSTTAGLKVYSGYGVAQGVAAGGPTSGNTAATEVSPTSGLPQQPSTGRPTSEGQCIRATLPDILGIGECLKDKMDMCQENETLFAGSSALITCTVRGVISNVNLRDGLVTLRTIFTIFVKKIAPSVTRIVDLFLGVSTNTPNDGAYRNVVCKGAIEFSFPSSWGQCVNQTLMVCENGKPVNAPLVKSLVASNECILNKLLTTAPRDTLQAVFCDLVDAAEVFASLIPGGKLLYKTFLGNLCD